MSRNKPYFARQGWNRYKRLGKTIKKKRVWRYPVGGDSKTRLKERGKPTRPTIGWGAKKSEKGKILGLIPIRIENFKDFEKTKDKKTFGVIIGSVGEKKRKDFIKKANELGLKILNKYQEKKW